MIPLRVIEIKKPEEFAAVTKLPLPLERVIILFSLDPDTQYSAENIADAYYKKSSQEHRVARKAFNKLSMQESMRIEVDNVFKKPGEPIRWCGSTWVRNLGDDYASYAYRFMEEFKARIEKEPGTYYLDGDKILTEEELLKRPKLRPKRKKPETKMKTPQDIASISDNKAHSTATEISSINRDIMEMGDEMGDERGDKASDQRNEKFSKEEDPLDNKAMVLKSSRKFLSYKGLAALVLLALWLVYFLVIRETTDKKSTLNQKAQSTIDKKEQALPKPMRVRFTTFLAENS